MTPATNFRELERLTTVAQLGVRFWDTHLDRPVTDGLRATAYDEGGRHDPIPAVWGPSGVASFHGLPGMRDHEFPEPDGVSGTSPPTDWRFIVSAEDRLRRFLPLVFRVRLPLPHGLVGGSLMSPPVASPPATGGGGRAHLHSAPTRATPGRVATIRADLWDWIADGPAAHAVVIVTAGGRTANGIADEEGRVHIVMPYPRVNRLAMASPPPSTELETWPLQARVQYSPDRLVYPLDSRLGPDSALGRTPSLKAVLEDQSDATIFRNEPTTTSPPSGGVTVLDTTLGFGQALFLKSTAADVTNDTARLFVEPN